MNRLLLAVFIFVTGWSLAQNEDYAVGDWKTHLCYRNIEIIEPAGDRIYAGGSSGFFYLDLKTERYTKIDNTDGLSGLGVSALHYIAEFDMLIIGYKNGNIDLLISGNEIFNINNISRSTIQGSKEINQITHVGSTAYLSCDFGIVNLNLERLEIKETYTNIGDNGSQVEVSSTLINGDTLYALTENGLQKAVIDGSKNLLDFNSWFTYIRPDNGNNYAGLQVMALFHDTVFVYRRWNAFHYVNGDNLKFLGPNNIGREVWDIEIGMDKLYVSHSDSTIYEMRFIGDSLRVYDDNAYFKFHQDFAIQDSSFWFAHVSNGLVEYNIDGRIKKYIPNGLATNSYFRLYQHDELTISTAGGYDQGFVQTDEPAAVSIMNGSRYWNGFSDDVHLYFPSLLKHLVSYTYNPTHGLHYLGTFNSGLLTWDGDTTFILLNENNSPLTSSLSTKSWVKTPGLFTDIDNNTWVSNHEPSGSGPGLFMIPADTSLPWNSYSIGHSTASWIADIKVQDDGNVWCLIGGPGGKGGIIYFNPETGEHRYLSDAVNGGGLPNLSVNDFDFDRDGSLWVGTAEGVAVLRDVEEILDQSSYNAELPIFEGRPLLQDEAVTSVVVDGGNRKWFGTTNGVFLFNEDVSEILAVFNEDNSPLISNQISDIVINDITGEVFFSTDKGINSFWGDATNAEEFHSDVKLFPNPVSADFEGMVSIQGLSQDAIVKITDVSGNLVREVDAEGGMATWDLLDIDGRHVEAGVFLFYSLSQTGDDSFVGKIVVTN